LRDIFFFRPRSETQGGTLSPLPVITIGGVPATVTFAGLVSPGLFQFNVVVPASVPTGSQPFAATCQGFTTQGNASIVVAPM
jgi:uncharacterized protein (TIGR03437 family)